MDILIDYLSFSSKIHSYPDIIDLLGLGDVVWIMGNPRHGWQEHSYFNGMHIYHGGREDIGVELSGIGCRTLESCWAKKFDWPGLLKLIMENRGDLNISRLDVACDDREYLDVKTITRYTSDRKYISKARRCVWMSGDEQEVIFGSSQSSTRLRIYNKALERGVPGKWTRVEFQLRDEAAESFIGNLILYKEDFGRTFAGILLNYLRYTTKAPDLNNHHNRLKTVKWWREFLGTSEKIKNLTIGGLEYNYSNLESFIKKQCLSSLKCFVEINGGSVDALLNMISDAKLNKRQEELIQTLRQIDTIEQNINFVQFKGGGNGVLSVFCPCKPLSRGLAAFPLFRIISTCLSWI